MIYDTQPATAAKSNCKPETINIIIYLFSNLVHSQWKWHLFLFTFEFRLQKFCLQTEEIILKKKLLQFIHFHISNFIWKFS